MFGYPAGSSGPIGSMGGRSTGGASVEKDKDRIGPSMHSADCRRSIVHRHSRVPPREEWIFSAVSLSSHGRRCKHLPVYTHLSGVCLTSCIKLAEGSLVIGYFLLGGSVALGDSIAILSMG